MLGEILGKDTVTLQLGAGLVPVALERDVGRRRSRSAGCRSRCPGWAVLRPARPSCSAALGAEPVAGGLPVEWYDNGPLNVYVEIAE